MKKTVLVAFAYMLSGGAGAWAKDVEGVRMPETIQANGKELKLNGAGKRTKMMFKVYVAGLYLEQPTHDAQAAVASNQVKRVEMVMLRDLERKKIVDAIRDGFENNNKAQMPALEPRLQRFAAAMRDLKQGERLTITFLPDKGTVVTSGNQEVVIEGQDFAAALLSVWLGKKPVDDGLKKSMLGM